MCQRAIFHYEQTVFQTPSRFTGFRRAALHIDPKPMIVTSLGACPRSAVRGGADCHNRAVGQRISVSGCI